MLRRGDGLQVSRIVALDALHVSSGKLPGQQRVFPEGFVVPTPPGITAHVHRRAPIVQFLAVQIVQRAHLIGDGAGGLTNKGRIPGIGQGKANRE